MAKIIKLTGYLVTDDDNIDEKEIAFATKEILSDKFDCIGKPFKAEVATIEDWNDNHELNYINSTTDVCEKYFK